MNLPFFIARKYFLSGKKKNFINIISLISMIVVGFGTMSLIIALSVFNGLEGLLRSLYGNFDPSIIVTASEGKSFKWTEDLQAKIVATDGVLAITEVIEDNVLVKYKEAQRVVRLKGASSSFQEHSGIKEAVVSGEFSLERDSIAYALIGRGIQYDLSINLKNEFYTIQVYYPKNIAPGVVNPEQLYTLKNILPGGIFAIEKYYDENFIFVPLQFAQNLFRYGDKRTSLEVEITPETTVSETKELLQVALGSDFVVRSGDELHSDLYKTLNIEKLFLLVTLSAIIAIASVNIFFSLSMLAIEKKKDISVLIANGASTSLIKRIFLYEGGIIALSGATLGLVLGLIISLLQQEFGFISMGMDSAVVPSYPVSVEWPDVIITVLITITITFLVSIQPARKASKSFSTHTLQ
ncbi:MAG: FtsX-like permease family protein [Cyclobacteriaceae bacterium]